MSSATKFKPANEELEVKRSSQDNSVILTDYCTHLSLPPDIYCHCTFTFISASVIRQYKLLWLVSSVKLLVCDYLLSSLVPRVGCSGSSNDLSKDSSLASFISDLEQDILKSITGSVTLVDLHVSLTLLDMLTLLVPILLHFLN